MHNNALIRVVRMTFLPENTATFLQLFERSKDKIRNFPGCEHLELWQDESNPNVWMTYSYWQDEKALNNYRNSALFASVWKATKALFAAKPYAFSSRHKITV